MPFPITEDDTGGKRGEHDDAQKFFTAHTVFCLLGRLENSVRLCRSTERPKSVVRRRVLDEVLGGSAAGL